MKAIVRCEWNTMRTFLPSVAVTVVLVGAFLVLGGSPMSGVGGTCATALMLVASSLAGYDDQGGWMRYRCAFPFSRREIVVGRYVSVMLMGLGVAVASLVAVGATMAVLSVAGRGAAGVEPGELVLGAVASESAGLLVVAVALPFCFRFGAVRGLRLFACVALVLGAFAACGLSGLPSVDFAAEAGRLLELNVTVSVAGFVAVAILGYVVSCLASIRIVERKDL